MNRITARRAAIVVGVASAIALLATPAAAMAEAAYPPGPTVNTIVIEESIAWPPGPTANTIILEEGIAWPPGPSAPEVAAYPPGPSAPVAAYPPGPSAPDAAVFPPGPSAQGVIIDH